MPRKPLSLADMTRLLGTIDGLALALASHNHKWTQMQRRVYERAVRMLKRAGADDAAA